VEQDERIAALERRLQHLTDRQDILDCIADNARGCDRFDVPLLAGAYHADGIDEHGNAVNKGPDYPAWANGAHEAMFLQTMHNITTHRCEIDGDTAHAESYSVGLFLDREGKTGRIIAGRYADRLERRDGAWRIALRRATVDFMMTGDASELYTAEFASLGYLKGVRGPQDVTYRRPLDLTGGTRW